MKKTITTLTLLLTLTSCTKTIYQTTPTTTTTTPKTTTTHTPRPTATPQTTPNNTYNPEQYDTFIWQNANDFWWLFTTEELLQMGLLVCQEFDNGQTIEQVSANLTQIMINTNTTNLMDGLAALTASALTNLCPEHQWWLNTL